MMLIQGKHTLTYGKHANDAAGGGMSCMYTCDLLNAIWADQHSSLLTIILGILPLMFALSAP